MLAYIPAPWRLWDFPWGTPKVTMDWKPSYGIYHELPSCDFVKCYSKSKLLIGKSVNHLQIFTWIKMGHFDSITGRYNHINSIINHYYPIVNHY